MSAAGKLLICPICRSGLKHIEAQHAYQCMNRHSFDIARQGYVNLLSSNQKNSKTPGDSLEMVQARREFLSRGYYEELSNRINILIRQHFNAASEGDHTVLDIGCGEGYYLSRLIDAAASTAFPLETYGMDISKDAVKYASSAVKRGTWLVGNSHRIPLKGGSFDCVLSVFSPIVSAEVARLLKPEGIFIRVLPGVKHLIQLREIIYPEVILSPEKDPAETYAELAFLNAVPVTYDILLTAPELAALVKMTPHYWKTTKADKEALYAIEELTVTVDMRILVYGNDKEAHHV